MNRIIQLVVAFLIALAPHVALAEEAAPDGGGGFFSGLENIAERIKEKVNDKIGENFLTKGMVFSEKLTVVALSLGGGLAFIYLLVEMIKSMGGRGDPPMYVLMDTALPIGIAAALIKEYANHIQNFRSLLDSVTSVAPAPMEGLAHFFSSTMSMLGHAIAGAYDNAGWGNLLGVVDLIATVLFCLPMLYILFAGLGEIVAILLLGPFLFAVGAAFGPVFIATLVTPWTRDYFGKWVGFMVAAQMVTGVAGVAIGIAAAAFEAMNFTSVEPGANEIPVAVSLGIAAIMLMSVNAILGQIPSIASALVPGTIGASKSGAGQMTQAVKNSKGPAKLAWNKAGGPTLRLALRGAKGAAAKINARFAAP